MIRLLQGLFIVAVFILTSCRPNEPTIPATPTPFESTKIPPRAPAEEPIPISLSNLAANPDFFEGSTLLLTGTFTKLPVLSCKRDPHPSPATWGLISEGFLANASGQDEQLRSLLAENQPITVEGRWLHYLGPIGCGKSATVQEIYYLSVDRVVEPNPLARATSSQPVPSAGPTQIAAVTEPIITPQEGTVIPTEFPIETPTEASFFTPTETVISSPPTATGTEIPNTTLTAPTPNPIPSPTVTVTTTVMATTTPVGTVTPGGVTGTPTTTTTSTTPSPTPGGQDITDKGSIELEDLRISALQSNEADKWTVAIDSASSITVTVAPGPSANLAISIIDETGTKIVDTHNQMGEGQVETLQNFEITTPGLYNITIDNLSSVETDYALMVLDGDSYSFVFKGTLVPSSPRNDTLEPDTDHFWFFPLMEGDLISLRVTPNNQSDPYLELYDPAGTRLQTIDNTGTNETELLEDFEADTTGLYSIRVGEFDFGEMTYQILLTK